MDENEILATETDESTEDTELDAAFDEEWGDASADDDDFDLTDDGGAEEGGSQPEEADEPEEEAAETAGETAKQQEETDAAEQSETEPEVETFTLKFLGEEKSVSRDEVIELAEKGSNYDHVKEERDSLRKDKSKLEGYESFLKELADASGTDIAGLIESTRATLMVQKAKAEGKELSEAAAIEQIRRESREAAEKQAEQKPEEPAKPDAEEAARRENFRKFMAAYPNVKAADIPQEVWNDSFKTGDLAGAYARWENKQLKAENEKLKQNQKNKERSTGSRRTAGATTPKDDFDEAWDSD